MKKILFITMSQFGSNTDSIKYCEYLNHQYKIEYLCFDRGLYKTQNHNIKVIYIPHKGPYIYRGLSFILSSIVKCMFFKGFIFIVFFPKCSIIKKVLFWKKMHIDIRTLSVLENENERKKQNTEIIKTINLFNSASFITENIRNIVSPKNKIKTYILPLGADIISYHNKDFHILKLLYIGTLNNRNILQTIMGVEQLIRQMNFFFITYDIIGTGNEYEIIKKYIQKNKIDKYIHLHGRLPYSKLKPFLDKCNIGISYIPITDYYEYQPPTKTFEYILSGLFCLATNTYSNRKIINNKNGILIRDTPNDFTKGLIEIYKIRNELNSQIIRETLMNYQWKDIINKYLIPVVEQN